MSSNIGDLTGQQLGTCILEKLIGQGGMGAVYLARQIRPSRNVAVKVLQPHLAMDRQTYQDFLARFRREADVIARLEHPNIIPIYEYGEQEDLGLAYLVMPYLSGGSLRDVLSKRGPLPLQETAQYLDQAAAALDYAHAQGVIHRDLKPANFLLHADGRLMLADFGIARILEESKPGAGLTSTGTILGTPEYMPPEMARGEPIDARADIYELGVVLFQMLSGHVPFTGASAFAVITKHVQEPLPLLHVSNPALPPAVDAVIQRATAKRREDRYPTAQLMAREFRNATTMQSLQQVNNPNDLPTVLSSGQRPVVLPHAPSAPPPLQTQYAAPAQPQPYPITNPVSRPNTMPPQATYVPVYHTPYPSAATNRPPLWMIVVGLLLVAALVIGGIFMVLQITHGGQPGTPTPVATTTPPAPTTTTVATTTAQPSPTATAGTTPTAQPTITPTPPVTPTTGPILTPTPSIPTGNALYGTAAPGPGCDKGGGQWGNFNNASVSCSAGKTQLNHTSATGLQGIILTEIPAQSYPANYIIELHVQPDPQSTGDFGIYFRNQPGSNHLGTYTFMVHPDGTWSAFVYDDTTGAAKELQKGSFGDAHAAVTVDVAVNGDQFSFYANGKQVGSVSDATYPGGTVGIAVDSGANIATSNFALYTPA